MYNYILRFSVGFSIMSMYNYILRFSVGFSIMSMVDVDALNNKNNIINRKVAKVYLNHPKG